MKYKFWSLIFPVIITVLGSNAVSASAAIPGPDLIIEMIILPPQNPSLGDTVTFTAIVKNIGSERAGISKIDYYIDNSLIFSDLAGAVEPGTSTIMNATWKAQAGDHIIKAVANADRRVIEVNETNNDLTIAFSVLAPNLVISEITWSPESSSVQEKVTFNVTVKNQGNGTAGYSTLDFFIDGASRGYREVQGLNAGAAAPYTFQWLAQPGSHDITAVADVLEKVIESDEKDNARVIKYSTLTPDLVSQNITWSTSNLSAGHDIPITAIIKNQGKGTSYSSWVTYYIDGLLMSSALIPSLSSNATVQNTFLWKAESGSHSVTAVVDSQGTIAESDETNNSRTESLPVIAPDLVVQSIIWSPIEPLVGQRVTFTVTVKNQGYADVTGVTLLQFNIDSLSYYTYLGDINAGATISATFNNWVAQPDVHVIRAIADAENNVFEVNELNNIDTVTISPPFPLPPDLLVQNITWSPKNPVVGEIVDFTITVKNQGTGTAGLSTISFYMDDFYLAASSVSPIDSGKTTAIALAWQASGGSHSFKAIADSGQIVPEQNETNNVYTASVPVLAPDLIIEDISWTPAKPSQGDSVTFTITVTNQGNYKANHSSLDYYVDGSPRGNHYLEELGAGAAVTKTFTYVAPSDRFEFRVFADVEDKISELDETNNENKIVFPAPDKTTESIVSNGSNDTPPVPLPIPVSDNTTAPAVSGQDVIAPPAGQTGNVSAGEDIIPAKSDNTQAKSASPFKPVKEISFNWWLVGSTSVGTVIIGAAIILVARSRKTGRQPLVQAAVE